MVAMWELLKYYVGTFAKLMVSMVSCGNYYDTMWELLHHIWCPKYQKIYQEKWTRCSGHQKY